MAELTAAQQRALTVAKANEIVQNTRYSLTAQQQKMLLYMIGHIKPTDTGTEQYTFDIQEFCEATGLQYDHSFYYESLKKSVQELRDSSVWVKIGKKHILLSWLDTAEIEDGSGTIKITFSKSVQPYLFELKERYVSYKLHEVLVLKSKYAIRLYELIKSYAYGADMENGQGKEIAFDPQELKQILVEQSFDDDTTAKSYDRYYNFKQRILSPAIEEINGSSEEINVELIEERTGTGSVKRIVFYVTKAKAAQVLAARQHKREKYTQKKR